MVGRPIQEIQIGIDKQKGVGGWSFGHHGRAPVMQENARKHE
jgi:hypothetical protein